MQSVLQQFLDDYYGIDMLNDTPTDLEIQTSEDLQTYLGRRMEQNPKSNLRRFFCHLRMYRDSQKLFLTFVVVAPEQPDALGIAEMIRNKLAKGLSAAKTDLLCKETLIVLR